jgi:DNA primase
MSQTYIDFGFVKENASFERVIAGYNLKMLGTGVQRAILCPFHRERKASCKVDLERKIFHCFGCEAKGNILEFVAKLEGDEDDLRAAALKIAELCGIATAAPREPAEASAAGKHRHKGATAQNTQGGSRRGRIAKAWSAPEGRDKGVAEARGIAQAGLTAGGIAQVGLTKAGFHSDAEPANPPLTFQLKLEAEHPYLAERGLSAELVAEFGLGYCNRGVMAGRVCIPIHNECAELVAYAGRWPGDELPEGVERYLLPKKFEKSRMLFNLHRAAAGEHVVLVEGYWSAIRLHTLGVPVAALMGCSISAEQLALLRERGVRFVTLLLDGDDAGHSARERVLPALADAFFVRAPLLPDGEKPDTVAEAELRELVEFIP